MTRFQKAVLACLLGILATASSNLGASGGTPPSGDPLSARISVDLEDADAADVLRMFAQISEAELDLAPAVEGKVTLRLRKVTARTALNATCESIGCRWRIRLGSPDRLVVVAEDKVVTTDEVEFQPRELGSQMTIQVKDADAAEAFRASARVLGATSEVDPAVSGRVTLSVRDRSMREIFDLLCEQVSCRWEFTEESGDAPVLRVMPR